MKDEETPLQPRHDILLITEDILCLCRHLRGVSRDQEVPLQPGGQCRLHRGDGAAHVDGLQRREGDQVWADARQLR